jgi:predicted nucleic acid-binding protein
VRRVAAISDSSPLILFGRIGRLDLIHSVFTELLIPPAVQREVAVAGAGRPGAASAAAADWITVKPPTAMPAQPRPFGPIGTGETEVIALALELAWDEPVLLDDLAARRIAERHGLLVTGSGGVLVRAKDRGLISAVAPVLRLLQQSGLYLSPPASERILAAAGESGLSSAQPDA